MHVFAEEELRYVFDIIAITYEKGAKSSLYRALPDITSNRRYIGSPPCQQISSSLYRPFRYSGPRYIGPPTVPTRTNLKHFGYSKVDKKYSQIGTRKVSCSSVEATVSSTSNRYEALLSN